MSLHRRAARRDDNEPAIMKAFAAHGWHVEQLSAAGMPDLLAFAPVISLASGRQIPSGGERVLLVDVKGLGKHATPAQAAKWKALAKKGIPVYVARTTNDVRAIVAGAAEAWASERPRVGKATPVSKKVPGVDHCLAKGCFAQRDGNHLYCVAHSYTPPRSPPVDAPALAAETFAPLPVVVHKTGPVAEYRRLIEACSCTRDRPCAACSVVAR